MVIDVAVHDSFFNALEEIRQAIKDGWFKSEIGVERNTGGGSDLYNWTYCFLRCGLVCFDEGGSTVLIGDLSTPYYAGSGEPWSKYMEDVVEKVVTRCRTEHAKNLLKAWNDSFPIEECVEDSEDKDS